jgi:hypothetical protein
MRVLLVILSCSISNFLAAENLPMDTILPSEKQKEMGLDTLTKEQKQAFESWIGSWTKQVIEQAPSYTKSETLTQWIESWPLASQPVKKAPEKEVIAQEKELNRKVLRVKNNGAIVELKDGSVWQVIDVDQYISTNWQRDDKVDWTKNTFTFPAYFLKNITQATSVGAEMVTAPSKAGKRAEDKTPKNAVPIVAIEGKQDGQYAEITGKVVVQLEDGTSWQIAPLDQERARQWKKGDRITRSRSNDLSYPTLLHNFDSGETVKSIPKPK